MKKVLIDKSTSPSSSTHNPKVQLAMEGILLKAYKAATSEARCALDYLLAKQAYLAGGHHAYSQWQRNNAVDRHACFLQITALSWELADAWHAWANVIQAMDPPRVAILEIVHGLICQTVILKSLEFSVPGHGLNGIEL